jgi:hypothetical protein
MRTAIKVIGVVVGVPLLLLIGCFAVGQALRFRATPPQSVTDVVSCLEWLKQPAGAFRITSDGLVHYQVTGPSGRFFASGPAGYTFDSQGKFIGWSPDIGDFEIPPEVFTPNSEREVISLDELRQSF